LTAVAALVLVFPTPPLPPTKTYLRPGRLTSRCKLSSSDPEAFEERSPRRGATTARRAARPVVEKRGNAPLTEGLAAGERRPAWQKRPVGIWEMGQKPREAGMERRSRVVA